MSSSVTILLISLTFPILTYNIELWYNSASQFERDKLLKPFDSVVELACICFIFDHKPQLLTIRGLWISRFILIGGNTQ